MKQRKKLLLLAVSLLLLCALTACGNETDTPPKTTTATTAHEHTYGEWTVKNEATCTDPLVRQRVCSTCSDTETETLEALGHDIIPHDFKAKSCTEKGWEAYETCSRCDYSTFKEIDASHEFKKGVCTACNTDTVTDWYDESKTEYKISDSPSLRGLAKLVNEGVSFEGKTIVLISDIDLEKIEWIPIGTEEHPFKGTLDGNDVKIIDLSMNNKFEYMGLFGVNCGTIKNLVIDKATIKVLRIEGVNSIGVVAGLNIGGTITNVTVNESTVSATVKTDVIVGGLIGTATENSKIERCSVVGGSVTTVENDVMNQTSIIESQTGGLIGKCVFSSVSLSFSDTTVKVDSTNAIVGGLIAHNVETKISDCYSLSFIHPAVSGNMKVGGLIGHNENSNVKNSYVSASIRSNDPYYVSFIPERCSGMLIGMNEDSYVDSCFTAGTLIAFANSTRYGLIVGKTINGEITNCFYAATASFSGSNETTGIGEKKTGLELCNNIMGWSESVWEIHKTETHPVVYPTFKEQK